MYRRREFRIGDVVKLVKRIPSTRCEGPELGSIGVVVYVGVGYAQPVGVRWDKAFPGGHNGNSNVFCENGHGWYCNQYKLKYQGWRVNPQRVSERK